MCKWIQVKGWRGDCFFVCFFWIIARSFRRCRQFRGGAQCDLIRRCPLVLFAQNRFRHVMSEWVRECEPRNQRRQRSTKWWWSSSSAQGLFSIIAARSANVANGSTGSGPRVETLANPVEEHSSARLTYRRRSESHAVRRTHRAKRVESFGRTRDPPFCSIALYIVLTCVAFGRPKICDSL